MFNILTDEQIGALTAGDSVVRVFSGVMTDLGRIIDHHSSYPYKLDPVYVEWYASVTNNGSIISYPWYHTLDAYRHNSNVHIVKVSDTDVALMLLAL